MSQTIKYPIRWITPAIATGYAPTSHDDLDTVRENGISVIVNMCAECYDLAEIEQSAGFDVCPLPVHDMEAPAAQDLDQAIQWFDNHLKAGRKGLIHCRYGLGRTGTFALAYLIHTGDTLKSAIAKIKATPAMPQTREQWDFIEQYARKRNLLLERRLRDQIDARLERTPIRYNTEKLWGRVRGVWNFEVWVIDNRPLTVKKIVVALIILVAGITAARILMGRLTRRLLYRLQIKTTTAATLDKLLHYAAYLMVVLFALRMINIPLAAFAFLGGAIAIGIGFGAQNLINNFISGFIIMGEQPISIGDLIEVDGVLGQVEEIGARCTQIRTGENIHILVPNSSFLEKNITNWTLSDRIIRAHVTVGVIYGSPVDQVQKLLLRACRQIKAVRESPEPFVLFTDFGDNALMFEVHFWISVQRIIERRMIESSLRVLVDELFRQAEIVIAFPQRDVHLDSPTPLKIQMVPADRTDPQDHAA